MFNLLFGMRTERRWSGKKEDNRPRHHAGQNRDLASASWGRKARVGGEKGLWANEVKEKILESLIKPIST